jgi:hypothetical protein
MGEPIGAPMDAAASRFDLRHNGCTADPSPRLYHAIERVGRGVRHRSKVDDLRHRARRITHSSSTIGWGAMSRRLPSHECKHLPLFGVGALSEETLERCGDDSPLRCGADDTQRL